MHRRVFLLSATLIYFAVSSYALVVFDAGIIASACVLFGIPAYLLARYSSAPTEVLVVVGVFGAGLSLLLEGVAHIYGTWYTIGVEELRVFGLIPLEVIGASVLQMWFLVLLYELLFDDGQYSTSHARTRLIALSVFFVGALSLILMHQYLLNGIFFGHSYLWIVGILVASTFTLLSVTNSLTVSFLDRLFVFMCYCAVPLSCSLFVSIQNTHVLFAYAHDYVYTFSLFNTIVPIEAILFLFVFPVFIATMYEFYLDDRA